MKSVLIIGMGRMGRYLAKKMYQMGNDVMIVDQRPEVIEALADRFTDSSICDCTNDTVIKSLGVDNFDVCFVTIGEDFQASLVVTSLLKKHGARRIVAKTNQSIQADLLRTIGADEVVYAEAEVAEKLAIRYNADNIFDFVPLTDKESIYEIPILPGWAGKTVVEVNVRKKHGVNIIAVKNGKDVITNPGAEYVFRTEDHIIVIGQSDKVFKLAARA